jgi:hypothetical protein
LDDLGKVQRFAISLLRNLLTAAEAVRHNDGRILRFSYCGQQAPFANGDRDIVFIVLKSKRPRHAAAAGVQNLSIEAELFQY